MTSEQYMIHYVNDIKLLGDVPSPLPECNSRIPLIEVRERKRYMYIYSVHVHVLEREWERKMRVSQRTLSCL